MPKNEAHTAIIDLSRSLGNIAINAKPDHITLYTLKTK